MSDTPRTDAVTYDVDIARGDALLELTAYPDGYGDHVPAVFARLLERELAEAREENTELRILLACRIAGPSLYHDDGELQDASMAPFIDWRRDSVKTIQEKLWGRLAIPERGGEVK